MASFLQVAAGFLSAALLASGAEPGITREGEWWVRTIAGSEAVPHGSRVRILAHGGVVLNGEAADRIHWVLKARAKARSEGDARARLAAVEVRFSKQAGQAMLVVHPAHAELNLNVRVPRGVPEISVASAGGSLEAAGVNGAVTLASGGGELRADRIGGDLVARTGGGEIKLGEIEGSARCATGGGEIHARVVRGEAVLETGAGDITVDVAGGAVRATTVGGEVRIGRAGAGVIASTGGGRIEVGEARGLVEARNAGGPVQVGAAAGVRCETATGAIRLINVFGSLRASTAIGSIVAQVLAGRSLSDSFLTTGRGDITVVIPSNVGVRIRAENETAGGTRRIVSDFPGIATRVEGAQMVAEGEINGGGPLLRLSGTGGIIFIKRQ